MDTNPHANVGQYDDVSKVEKFELTEVRACLRALSCCYAAVEATAVSPPLPWSVFVPVCGLVFLLVCLPVVLSACCRVRCFYFLLGVQLFMSCCCAHGTVEPARPTAIITTRCVLLNIPYWALANPANHQEEYASRRDTVRAFKERNKMGRFNPETAAAMVAKVS